MIQLIDDNFNRHIKRTPRQIAGMRVVESGHLTYVDSGLSCDTFNIIHLTDGRRVTESELANAIQHFQDQQRDHCLWVNREQLGWVEAVLARLALTRQAEEVGMVLGLDQYVNSPNPLHEHVRVVRTRNALRAYARVIAENWEPPDQNVLAYYDRTADQYLKKDNGFVLLLYYQEGVPAATLELCFSDPAVVGLYGLATRAAFRRQGIGAAMLTYGLNLAKERGCRHAVLQASEDGIGIYREYGFEAHTVYYEYA